MGAELISNYTTTIKAGKTVGEIQELLSKRGIEEIYTRYDKGEPASISFSYRVAGTLFSYTLPCKWQGIMKVLKRETTLSKYRTEGHARNVGWRIIKDWIEAQLSLVDAEMVSIDEVFFPYQLNGRNVTFYDAYKGNLLEVKNEEE